MTGKCHGHLTWDRSASSADLVDMPGRGLTSDLFVDGALGSRAAALCAGIKGVKQGSFEVWIMGLGSGFSAT